MSTHFCIFLSFSLRHRANTCTQTDPLSALLTKYVPAEQRPRRDVVGEYAGRDVHEMVVSCLHKVFSVFAIHCTSTLTSIPRTLSHYLHLSHTHFHYSSVSRICTRSFVILISLSLLCSVRSSTPHSFRGWRLLYFPTVARNF